MGTDTPSSAVDAGSTAGMGAIDALTAQIGTLTAAVTAKDESIAVLTAQVSALTEKVGELLKENARLKELLGRNSRNSNLPPSRDPPGSRSGGDSKDPTKGGKKKRGGQPGHAGKRRDLVDPTEVDDIVDLFPPACENCSASLPQVVDSKPERHQVVELPPIEAYITEFRRHTVCCPHCQHKTCAALDPNKIPASP